MKFKHFAIGLLAVGADRARPPHSFAMFELTKDVAYEGTVMEYRWENPTTPSSSKWTPAPPTRPPSALGTSRAVHNIMGRQGWNRATFKVGDHVKLIALYERTAPRARRCSTRSCRTASACITTSAGRKPRAPLPAKYYAPLKGTEGGS